jgi:hypothetical protein
LTPPPCSDRGKDWERNHRSRRLGAARPVLGRTGRRKGCEHLLYLAAEADKPLLIAAVNWAKVLYRMERKRGAQRGIHFGFEPIFS